MERRKGLEEAGIDVTGLLERCMDNEALALRLLGRFAADPSHDALVAAFAENDVEKAAAAAHSLKGVAANLSMPRLSTLAADQLALLRAGSLEEARGMLSEVEREHARLVAALGALL